MTRELPEIEILHSTDLPHEGRDPSQAQNVAQQRGLIRIHRGVYADPIAWQSLSLWEKHAVLVVQSVKSLRSDFVVAGASAAILWGIPFFGSIPDRTEVSCQRATGGRYAQHFIYRTSLRRPESQVLHGLPVTSPSRTAVDVARFRGFTSGLLAMDHVLHNGMASTAEIQTDVARLARTVGVAHARLALRFADARSESPGESLSRARILYLGAPVPELQFNLMVDGQFLGRLDAWWKAQRAAGEFDGLGKYGAGAKPLDVNGRNALIAEKLREDAIRPHVNHFIRWTWADLVKIDPFEAKLRQAGVLVGTRIRRTQFL